MGRAHLLTRHKFVALDPRVFLFASSFMEKDSMNLALKIIILIVLFRAKIRMLLTPGEPEISLKWVPP